MRRKKIESLCLYTLAALLSFGSLVSGVGLGSVRQAHAEGIPDVVINELMWMGPVSNIYDEWVEIFNPSTTSIQTLDDWYLTNARTSGERFVFPTGTHIAPQGYLLISRKVLTDSILKDNLTDVLTKDKNDHTLILNNSCPDDGRFTYMELIDPSRENQPVDRVGCKADRSMFAGGENPESPTSTTSMERNLVVDNGMVAGSWHSSVGFANLDGTPENLTDRATPKAVNDITPPDANLATVIDTDGIDNATDRTWTADKASLSTSWSGFVENESTLDRYEVVFTDDPEIPTKLIPWQDAGLATSGTFDELSLIEGVTYYIIVRSYNNVDPLPSAEKASNGITVNTTDPLAPTGVTALDTPNDNGGGITVSWVTSTSPDVTSYAVGYRKAGEASYTYLPAGLLTVLPIAGLENDPVSYDIVVRAIDFNNQFGESLPISGVARDNLAPTIVASKVVINQNKPGTNDTISGSAGAISELATVNIFDGSPELPNASLISSIGSLADGSFPALAIGDNKYPTVYLQAVDKAGNASNPVTLGNDITGPNSALLQSLTSNCLDTCRVSLAWKDNGPDTDHYQISYALADKEVRTTDVNGTTLSLDLPLGTDYAFSVYAYDKAGNPSVKSNTFKVALVRGVTLSSIWQDGQQVTTTSGNEGARVTKKVPAKKSAVTTLVSPAKAAEPVTTDTSSTPVTPDKTETEQDWVRIFVVVALLIVVGGSFYALSRTAGRNGDSDLAPILPLEDDTPPMKKPAKKPTRVTERPKRKNRRR